MLQIVYWVDKKLASLKSSSLYEYYIGKNELIEDEKRFYITNSEKGVGFVLSDSLIIRSIHLYGENKNNIIPYNGEFPLDIDFSSSRDRVKEKLGIPYRTGGGHRNIYLGFIQVWDRYLLNDFSIHYQYSDNLNSINLITIGSLSLENQLNSKLQ